MSTIVVIKLSVTSRKYFLVFNMLVALPGLFCLPFYFIFFFFFIIIISCGNVINVKISTTKLPLKHVLLFFFFFFFKVIYVPLSEYQRGICSAQMVPISQSAHRLICFSQGLAYLETATGAQLTEMYGWAVKLGK